MKILFLCSRKHFINKLSRIRFHGIEAIGRHPQVQLIMSGPGFDGFKNAHNEEKKHAPLDLVIWYKPLDIPGHEEVRSPKCLRYNETYDHVWTCKEIGKSKSDFVIFHHENDLAWYISHFQDKELAEQGITSLPFYLCHVPHCAEKTIFKDYKQSKTIDLLLSGSIQPHYPLRERMVKIFKKMPERYRCRIYPHPGYDHSDAYTNKYLKEFAKAINQAKIAITCSGKPRSRYGKYIEIPMCNTAIAADMPGQDEKEFKKFLIEIDRGMTDEKIMETLIGYLENPAKLGEITRAGCEWAKGYTQESYAEMFVKKAKIFLEKHSKKKDYTI